MTINRRQSIKTLIRYILLLLFAGAGSYAWHRDRIDIKGSLVCSTQDCASCQQSKSCNQKSVQQKSVSQMNSTTKKGG